MGSFFTELFKEDTGDITFFETRCTNGKYDTIWGPPVLWCEISLGSHYDLVSAWNKHGKCSNTQTTDHCGDDLSNVPLLTATLTKRHIIYKHKRPTTTQANLALLRKISEKLTKPIQKVLCSELLTCVYIIHVLSVPCSVVINMSSVVGKDCTSTDNCYKFQVELIAQTTQNHNTLTLTSRHSPMHRYCK